MKKPRILIVDDDQISRACVALVLKNAGYEISEAFNGIRAVDMLENEKNSKVDAIILDRMMPEMSGIEVLKKIHEMPAPLCNIPIIMLTALAEQSHIKTAIAYGALDVLFKPIDDKLLNKALLSALNKNVALR